MMKQLSPLLLLLLCTQQVSATFDIESAGARIGFDDESSINLQSYEFFATWNTPWSWNLGEALELEIMLETSAGALDGEEETAGMLHLGFLAEFEYGDFPLSLIVSSGPTYLTEDKFKNHDLGSQLQFTSALGLDYECLDNWILGYRYQHISNAGLDDPNPGINMHVVCASYSF